MEWENVVAGQRADPEQINKIGNQVSAYKGLRLARRIVLTEVVSSITFDTDDDGRPLDSKLGGELLFYSGANTATATAYMQLNGVSTTDYWVGSSVLSYIITGAVGTFFSQKKIDINILSNNIVTSVNYSYRSDSGSGNYGVYGGGMTTPQTAVTAIKLFLSAGTFPAGTVVEWWERG